MRGRNNVDDILTYRVEITGQPTMRCELGPDPPESEGGLTVAAMHAVNGVPIVCAAALGLLGATEVTLGARTA